MADRPAVHLDLRAVLPIAALGAVVLVIIIVELCGREDVDRPLVQNTTPIVNPTRPPGTVATPPTPGVGPSPTVGPPTATEEQPAGGEGDRDLVRNQDLQRVLQALDEYRQENESYPDTGGQVQSLCVFEADVGCELTEFLDPLPADPLGEPISENGYWYAATTDSFTVYAQRESDEFPECSEHPDHLSDIDSVMCVKGP